MPQIISKQYDRYGLDFKRLAIRPWQFDVFEDLIKQDWSATKRVIFSISNNRYIPFPFQAGCYNPVPYRCPGSAIQFKPRSSLSADEILLRNNSLFGALRYSVRLNRFGPGALPWPLSWVPFPVSLVNPVLSSFRYDCICKGLSCTILKIEALSGFCI